MQDMEFAELQRKCDSMKATLLERELQVAELENKIAKLKDEIFAKDSIKHLSFSSPSYSLNHFRFNQRM